MASLGGSIEFLTAEDIAGINASLITSFGGWLVCIPNLRFDGPGLDFLLAAIIYPLGGIDLYPTVVDKAAFTALYIITRHPFHDTNKRTGMEAAIELLELNRFITHFKPAEIERVAIDVEAGKMDFVQLRAWIIMNVHVDLNDLR
ncbi:MAG: Fic family protein [Dehalococcoidia bacterium]